MTGPRPSSLIELSIELAELAAALPNVIPTRIAIAPSGSSDVIGLANLGVPVVLHPLDRLGQLESWIQDTPCAGASWRPSTTPRVPDS